MNKKLLHLQPSCLSSRHTQRSRFLGSLALVSTCLVGFTLRSADDSIDFRRDIQPILADHCFDCHGPDEQARQADLRLDDRSVAISKLASDSVAIVPGKPESSELMSRVLSNDPGLIMPPPEHNKPLDEKELSLLEQWIREGAVYTTHWAFTAPDRPELPDPAGENGSKHPIDRLVAHRLQVHGFKPSPPAAHEVLCRRIYLDLIGLPPAPEEIDKFVSEAQKDVARAVDDLIERLFQSDHFGEKWARHWLDVARYADSNGYEKDNPREQWAWRDWVIRAINSDMPYDQFILEQIAGDMLPDRTQDQLVATGFLRNGMINEEGAIVAEQFRMEGMFDRMDCIGKAVLGLSLQCGQCHSHKYDPISQDEYYGTFAFLNDTYESQSWVYTSEQQKKIVKLRSAVSTIEDRLRAQRPNWQQQFAAWERQERTSAPKWSVLDVTSTDWIGGLNHPEELPDHSVLVLGHPTGSGEMYVTGKPPLDGVTGLRLEALTHGDLPYGGPGRSKTGTFAITELRVEVKPPGGATWETVELSGATADYSEESHVLEGDEEKKAEEQRRVGPVEFLIDGDKKTAWRSDRGSGRRNTESVAVIQFAAALTRPEGTELKVSLEFHHTRSRSTNPLALSPSSQLGCMRFATTTSPAPRAPSYDHAATLALGKPASARSEAENATVFAAWRRGVPEFQDASTEIESLFHQYPEAPTSVLTLTARRPAHHRATFLLNRGIWDKPERRITPHSPAALHSLPSSEEHPDRLDFARWLVDSRSPLTARVHVNRVWQAIFGAGLVETPEDFGTRAPQPEHLELLDWLAVELMERGWSTKKLIRTILTSATYHQSSNVSPELLAADPQNRWLGRGPRFRVEAEVVRDIALSVSGLLHREVGGPSIFPPVPKSVLEFNYSPPRYWVAAEAPKRYRRALYVFRRRSMPDPVLTSFDAPNADFACARRQRSNTPLASLASLNEPIFVEAARALALRILREGGPNDAERTEYAFRLCTGRRPSKVESAEIEKLLGGRREKLAAGWLSINEVATGDPGTRPELPPDATPQDAAAWTIAARVLLNLDETVSKN